MLTKLLKCGNMLTVIALAIAFGYINLFFIERGISHVEGTS